MNPGVPPFNQRAGVLPPVDRPYCKKELGGVWTLLDKPLLTACWQHVWWAPAVVCTAADAPLTRADFSHTHMLSFCTQVIELSEYRGQLFDYLKSRMAAVAPNLTVLVGELVGARLIAHAGSLINLAKQPASTVQILGAEKALFRCAALALPCRTGRLITKPACSGSLPQPGV